jgi:outer membrane protein assembly factor BamB
MRSPASLVVLSLLAAGACGGGQTRATPFDPGWVDDHGAAMAAFQEKFASVRVPLGADVAVGVVGKEALVGVLLAGGSPWTFAHVVHGRPAVAGSVVVAAGGGEVFALDARTGQLLWSRPSGGRLRGAGDDGITTVISLIPPTGFGSVVLAVARDGSVVRQIEEAAPVGVPAVAGDTVFFPWKGHFLSAYDLPTGEEKARIAFPRPVSRAFALSGAIFAGEAAVTRVDDRLRRLGAGAATTVTLPIPLGGFPGEPGEPTWPAWSRPGTDWVNRESDATDRVRLYARPSSTGAAGVVGGRFAATYYRVALGLAASTGALAWAHAHDADFLGGAASLGGFALCDAAGTVTFFDGATGAVAGHVSLGKPVDTCLVQADGLLVLPVRNAAPLAAQLADTLRLTEPAVAPVQKLLRRAVARLEEDKSGELGAKVP